jgi:hypothetical protein
VLSHFHGFVFELKLFRVGLGADKPRLSRYVITFRLHNRIRAERRSTGANRPVLLGRAIVPIYRLLQNQAFGPEVINAMTTAFEDILRVLRLTDRTDPLATLIAKRIIEVAQTGEHNPDRIRQRVLQSDALDCRRQADRCLQTAQSAGSDAELTRLLLDMTQTWMTMARQLEHMDALQDGLSPRPVKRPPTLVVTGAPMN